MLGETLILSCKSVFVFYAGSQLRAWLLYFSLPVLKGILSSTYYSHLAYLVAAMHLLLGESISEIDLQNAQAFLLKFYVDMERLYGKYGYYITTNWVSSHLLLL